MTTMTNFRPPFHIFIIIIIIYLVLQWATIRTGSCVDGLQVKTAEPSTVRDLAVKCQSVCTNIPARTPDSTAEVVWAWVSSTFNFLSDSFTSNTAALYW